MRSIILSGKKIVRNSHGLLSSIHSKTFRVAPPFNSIWDPFRDVEAAIHPYQTPSTLSMTRTGDIPDIIRSGISIDIVEKPEYFEVHADLPGVSKNCIEVQILEHKLTVTATKSEEVETDNNVFYKRERSFGKAQRVLTLPAMADCEKPQAVFENGLLTLKFPKLQGEAAGTKVNIP